LDVEVLPALAQQPLDVEVLPALAQQPLHAAELLEHGGGLTG
jgi:hypothetical protein